METRTKVGIGIAGLALLGFLIGIWWGSQEALAKFDEVCPTQFDPATCAAAQEKHDLKCRRMNQAQSSLPRAMRRWRIFESRINPHGYVVCITGEIVREQREARLREDGYIDPATPE